MQVRKTKRPPTSIPTTREAHDVEVLDEMTDFLDEIDDLLEENALEVTQKFRQKGGQ